MLSEADRRRIHTWKEFVSEVCIALPRWWGEPAELENRAWVGLLGCDSLPDPIEKEWLELTIRNFARPKPERLPDCLLRESEKVDYTERLRQRAGVVDPLPED